MLIAGLLLGFLLGVTVTLVVWATGRRPYLRVDISQHRTTSVVHHVIDHAGRQEPAVPVVDGRVVAPSAVPPAPSGGDWAERMTRRVVGR
jgi:hypothetical protein